MFPDHGDAHDNRGERSAVAAAFGKLSARQRVAVMLRYHSGLFEAEIARDAE
jgi:DNA-directed RNA polymerase specialized sigma24 family protein